MHTQVKHNAYTHGLPSLTLESMISISKGLINLSPLGGCPTHMLGTALGSEQKRCLVCVMRSCGLSPNIDNRDVSVIYAPSNVRAGVINFGDPVGTPGFLRRTNIDECLYPNLDLSPVLQKWKKGSSYIFQNKSSLENNSWNEEGWNPSITTFVTVTPMAICHINSD